jgi:4,5:9,10-diseco-3-hydroxy-5,9,17-trioxoandrosta-1(10),2-diene-4-oate hydrolase
MSGSIEVDGVRLAYRDSGRGAGRPLVCLHAIGHDGGDFDGLAARLAGRRVIALDWPGQGGSAADRVAPSAARYQQLLAGFLDRLAFDEVVLVGNSIGAAAALRMAAAAPSRVRALVLMNPGGLDRGGWLARLSIRLMVAFFAAGARGARWFGRAFAFYYRQVLPRPAAAPVRDRIIADGYRLAPLLAEAWRGFGQPEADLRPLAKEVRCPTLFAWARRDRLIQLGRCRAAIARFPNARVETFDAGHAPQLETPDELAASVARFLASADDLRPAPALVTDPR